MLGHASIQQTQRYLNVTDEELRKRIGGELGPAASGCLTTVKIQSADDLSQICPTKAWKLAVLPEREVTRYSEHMGDTLLPQMRRGHAVEGVSRHGRAGSIC